MKTPRICSATAFINFFPFIIAVLLGTVGTTGYSQNGPSGMSEQLGASVNTAFDEANPVFTPDGRVLFFTRSNHPDNQGGIGDTGDIWYCLLDDNGQWTPAQNLGRPLNDRFKNGVIGFSPDGRAMYLRNNYINDHNNPVQDGISVAMIGENGWSYPENIQVRYFKNDSENQDISLSRDGNIMLLSIQSYGSYGGEDIYVSFRNVDGTFTEPKNLGGKINTAYQEMTPFLAPDNKTLYFSSNGHGGYGGRDIFVSRRLDDTWQNWSKPRNMGDSINSVGVELSYTIDPSGKYAYFVTTQNSNGYGDLRRIPIKNPYLPLEVAVSHPKNNNTLARLNCRVIDAKTGLPIAGDVYFDLEHKKSNVNSELAQQVISFKKGRFTTELLKRQAYELNIMSKGYMGVSESITIEAESNQVFKMVPLEKGAVFQFKNVLFEVTTANLMEESFRELDLIVRTMKDNPGMQIEVSGHTDNRGNARLNYLLSKERVGTVKKYLVQRGVPAARIDEKAYGGTRPIASNNTEETRKLNRRVEFKIINY